MERSRVLLRPGTDLSSATIEDLIGAIERFPGLLESGNDEERKAVVRAFRPGDQGGKGHEAGDLRAGIACLARMYP